MKKKVIGIMLGCLVFMSACASGQDKTGAVQSDAARSEDNMAHESAGELESPESQEAAFDPYTPNLNLPGVDPYEEGLFEVFGMDNNFPKPKDTFEQVWKYSTTGGEETDSKTGDMVQLPVESILTLEIKPQIYEDYIDEMEEYLVALYAKQSKGVIWQQNNWYRFKVLMDNGDYIDAELKNPIRFRKHSPSDSFELDVVVDTVYYFDAALYHDRDNTNSIKLKELIGYPQTIYVVTADGTEMRISYTDWCEYEGAHITHENATWERMPQVGDNIRIKGFIYDETYLYYHCSELNRYYDAGSAIITDFEFIDN